MIPLTNPDKKSTECCSQCETKNIMYKSKGLCKNCYNKQWYKDHPYTHEKYESIKPRVDQWLKDHPESRNKWRLNNPEKIKESQQKWQHNNPEKVKKYNQEYLKKHPEKKEELLLKFLESKNYNELKEAESLKKQTCKILKEHAKEMKDDPEHLTTEFMQKLIGIKCKSKRID